MGFEVGWQEFNVGLDEFELKGEMSLRDRDEVMLGWDELNMDLRMLKVEMTVVQLV